MSTSKETTKWWRNNDVVDEWSNFWCGKILFPAMTHEFQYLNGLRRSTLYDVYTVQQYADCTYAYYAMQWWKCFTTFGLAFTKFERRLRVQVWRLLWGFPILCNIFCSSDRYIFHGQLLTYVVHGCVCPALHSIVYTWKWEMTNKLNEKPQEVRCKCVWHFRYIQRLIRIRCSRCYLWNWGNMLLNMLQANFTGIQLRRIK